MSKQQNELMKSSDADLDAVFSVFDGQDQNRVEEQKVEVMEGLTQTVTRSMKTKDINRYSIRGDRNRLL